MEASLTDFFIWAFVFLIIYKVIDRVIRLPEGDPSGQFVFITGCDSGFGRALARRLDEKGCNVFATCMTSCGEDDLRQQSSGRLKVIRMDVSKPDDVTKAVEFVENNLPQGTGLWGLVNNAGTAGRVWGPSAWLPLQQYRDITGVNLLGVVDVTSKFVHLVKREKGRIVNVASIHGRTSLYGNVPYSITKYGVESFSDIIRREMRCYGISVHLIEPGFHRTNIINREDNTKSLTTAWNEAPPHIQQEYGKEFLQKAIKCYINELVPRIASSRIDHVTDAFEHALFGVCPRARYVLGFDANCIWLPLQWMPEWLGDWLMELLSPGSPLPNACR